MRIVYSLVFLLLVTLAKANDPIVKFPFTIEHGHIYIHLKLNGQDSLHVAFDTGARANLLDSKLALQLGIKASGSQTVQGVAGAVTMDYSSGNSFEIGDFGMRSQTFLMMDLDHLGDEDSPMDGVIGGGIFDNYIVEIDYDAYVIKLYEFRGYEAPADYEALKFSLRAFRIPIIPGTLFLPDGTSISGDFLVDTGASLAFSINTPFAKKHKLYSKMGETYQYKFRAVGNKNITEMARLEKASILGQSFENMTARLARSTAGVSGTTAVSGIVGLEVLKRFNTIYDYYRQTMYLKPSHYLDAPFQINYSGLSVKKQDGVFLVEDVYAGSAAEVAKIKIGDQIESIDGNLNMTRDEFHEYFQNAKGPVALKILSEGKSIVVNLRPRAMF